MGVRKSTALAYEECRNQRLEENQKRLEELNLVHLSRALQNLSPKSSPMKKMGTPRKVEKQVVEVRRSPRIANNPAPVYVEVMSNRISSPRKSYGVAKSRDLSNRVYATDEEREYAIEKAERMKDMLEKEGYPYLIRPMLPSHVTGGFWLGLPVSFCRSSLPRNDGMVTLVDDQGDEYPTVYLARKRGLSGGWKGFAEAHGLVDGDVVIFQVTRTTVLKVHILRVKDNEDAGTPERD